MEPPPAPDSLPVVGHTLSLLRDPLGSLDRWGRTGPAVVRLRIGGREFCLLTDPAAARQLLVTDSEQYRKAEIVRDRLGTLQGGSLVLLEGTEWESRRETLQSAMTRQRLAAAGELTTQYATEMVEKWPADEPVRAADEAQDLSLAILSAALFDLDIRGERTPIHEAADDILARMDLTSPSAYLPEWVPTPTNRRYRRAVSTLHDELDAIVEAAADDRSGGGRRGKEDLLSTMITAGLPPETVRDELIALLFAGYDSTATALACTLGLLGDHPEIQAELHSELSTVLDGRLPTPADLEELPLLDAVVRESLRLYPPQYLLFREPTEPVGIQGYRIEAGTTLVAPPWLLQRDERFWDEPAAFRPDRWLTESVGNEDNNDKRPDYAYFPYGGGKRHCLGRRLADQTLRLAVAVVCQHRQLRLTGSLSVTAGPTLSLETGVELGATPRK